MFEWLKKLRKMQIGETEPAKCERSYNLNRRMTVKQANDCIRIAESIKDKRLRIRALQRAYEERCKAHY